MKKSPSKKNRKPPQLLEKWTGGHAKGRLDSPASNKVVIKTKKKKTD